MVTFVKEYCTITKDFRTSDEPVIAIDVSSCCLLELNNRDDQGNRTVFSLSHFTSAQMNNLHIFDGNIDLVFKNFEENGGDLSKMQVRVFGGMEQSSSRDKLVSYLNDKLKRFDLSVQIPKDHNSKEGQSIDYSFYSNKITFRKMVDRDDISKDIVSKDLMTDDKPDQSKIDDYQRKIDQDHYPVSRVLERYVYFRVADVDNAVDKLEKAKSIGRYNKHALQLLKTALTFETISEESPIPGQKEKSGLSR